MAAAKYEVSLQPFLDQFFFYLNSQWIVIVYSTQHVLVVKRRKM